MIELKFYILNIGGIDKQVRLVLSLIIFAAFFCRNYHVFYYLLAGTSPEEKGELHLTKPEEYCYLNQVSTNQRAWKEICVRLACTKWILQSCWLTLLAK